MESFFKAIFQVSLAQISFVFTADFHVPMGPWSISIFLSEENVLCCPREVEVLHLSLAELLWTGYQGQHPSCQCVSGWTNRGCLGSWVAWMSDSWFLLRPWSQGPGIWLHTHHGVCGVCLAFSLSLSLCPSPTLSLSLSPMNKSYKKKKKIGMEYWSASPD